MSMYLSPVGLATTALVADQVSLLATFKERLCKFYNANGSQSLSIVTTYTHDTPKLVDGTTFVPIVATITVTIPRRCGCSATQVFTEHFYVAFQGQTTVPASVTITSEGTVNASHNTRCCKTNEIAIEDSLTITIA